MLGVHESRTKTQHPQEGEDVLVTAHAGSPDGRCDEVTAPLYPCWPRSPSSKASSIHAQLPQSPPAPHASMRVRAALTPPACRRARMAWSERPRHRHTIMPRD